MNYKNYFVHILLAVFFYNCSSFSLSQVNKEILKQNPKVGLHELEISIESEESSFSASLKKGLSSFLFPESKDRNEDKKKLREIVANTVLKNFLDKGFLPIEREKLRQILKEYSLNQTGITDSVKELKISGVDCIFSGALRLRVVHEFWSSYTMISFSGRLMKIDDGLILASGSISKKFDEIKEDKIIDLIDTWFSGLKSIR